MQLNGEAVQVTNVKWAKVTVESIVQECLVNAKVDGREHLVCWSCRAAMGARRALGRRLRLLGVRERGRRIRSIRVRGQVETVLDVLRGAGSVFRPMAHCFGGCFGAHLNDLAVAGRGRARHFGSPLAVRRHEKEGATLKVLACYSGRKWRWATAHEDMGASREADLG